MQTKRSFFPRFYFLSNDELLQILSNSRNPTLIQPYLRKCFDNINQVKFFDDSIYLLKIQGFNSVDPQSMPEYIQIAQEIEIYPGERVRFLF